MNEWGVALSTDLDGVVFTRIPVQVGATLDYLRRGQAIFTPSTTAQDISRVINLSPLALWERVSLAIHRLKTIPNQVLETLPQMMGVGVYGNTGRPFKERWVAVTINALAKAGILAYFEDIFFKPRGVSTIESKTAAIGELCKTYASVTHFDDDPKTALQIAARFPHVEVVIVQDLTTGLLYSRREAQRYPNVRRVASFRAGVQILGLDRYKSGLSLS